MKKKKLKLIATEKQMEMIKYIKDVCDVKFHGETPQDVYKFIGEWYPKAQKMASIQQQIGSMGVQTGCFHFTKRGMEHSVDDDWTIKDTLAHDILEGEIIRGRNPVDALCDFQERAFWEKWSPTMIPIMNIEKW